MINFRTKRFGRKSSKLSAVVGNNVGKGGEEIKWEMRPGGMLVQKREDGGSLGEALIKLRVSTLSRWHDISIEPTSTFGDLKMVLALVTGLEAREQRLLYRGKEREDEDYLHMVGVKDMDKVLLLEDPAIKDRKRSISALGRNQTSSCTISV